MGDEDILQDITDEFAKGFQLDEKALEELVVDPSLSDHEKILFFINSPVRVQVLSILYILPEFLIDCDELLANELVAIVFERFESFIPQEFTETEDGQRIVYERLLVLGKTFIYDTCRNRLVQLMVDVLKVIISNGGHSYCSPELSKITKLALEIIETTIMNTTEKSQSLILVMKSVLDDNNSMRSLCTRFLGVRMLGLVGRCVFLEEEENSIKYSAVEDLIELTQDLDGEVRNFACMELSSFSAYISPDVISSTILPQVIELLQDEDQHIIASSIQLVQTILPNTSLQQVEAELLPHVERIVDDLISQDFDTVQWPSSGERKLENLDAICSILGPIMFKLQSVGKSQLEDQGSPFTKFLKCFCSLCNHSLESIRYQCAYNFPGVLKSLGGANFAKYLRLPFDSLSSDSSPVVRACFAGSLHVSASLLGKQRMVRYGIQLFSRLCVDESISVRESMMPNLLILLDFFMVAEVEQRATTMKAILGPTMDFGSLHQINMGISRRFRLTFIEIIPQLPRYFQDSKALHERCVPLLLQTMREGGNDLKLAAVKSITHFMFCNEFTKKELKLVHDLKADFFRNQSAYLRLVYLEHIKWVAQVFDKTFWDRYRFDQSLEDLLEDPVCDVRERAASTLVFLLGIDIGKSSNFATLIRRVSENEESPRVKSIATIALNELSASVVLLKPAKIKHSNISRVAVKMTDDQMCSLLSMKIDSRLKKTNVKHARRPMKANGTQPSSPRVKSAYDGSTDYYFK